MQVLIYTSPFNPTGRKLLAAMRSLNDTNQVRHVADIEALTACLRQPAGSPTIAILAPSNPEELTAMINLRHLLRDMRIVLVLPDSEAPIVSDTNLLRPRYVSHGDGHLGDVAAVIRRMLQRSIPETVYAAR